MSYCPLTERPYSKHRWTAFTCRWLTAKLSPQQQYAAIQKRKRPEQTQQLMLKDANTHSTTTNHIESNNDWLCMYTATSSTMHSQQLHVSIKEDHSTTADKHILYRGYQGIFLWSQFLVELEDISLAQANSDTGNTVLRSKFESDRIRLHNLIQHCHSNAQLPLLILYVSSQQTSIEYETEVEDNTDDLQQIVTKTTRICFIINSM